MGPEALAPYAMQAANMMFQGRMNRQNQKFANKQRKKQNAYNMQMAEYNFNKNLEMYNLNNAYNTPTAQLERFQDAGINPNLIYGRFESGNASNPPQMQRPQSAAAIWKGEPIRMDPYMVADLKLKQAQTASINADTKLKEEQAGLTGLKKVTETLQQEGIKLGNDLKSIQKLYDQATLNGRVEKVEKELKALDGLIKNRDKDALIKGIKHEVLDARKEWDKVPSSKMYVKLAVMGLKAMGISVESLQDLLGGFMSYQQIKDLF